MSEIIEKLNDNDINNKLLKLSTEIKNPITVCYGYLDMIKSKDKEDIDKYILKIKKELDKSIKIIDEFISKIEKDQ